MFKKSIIAAIFFAGFLQASQIKDNLKLINGLGFDALSGEFREELKNKKFIAHLKKEGVNDKDLKVLKDRIKYNHKNLINNGKNVIPESLILHEMIQDIKVMDLALTHKKNRAKLYIATILAMQHADYKNNKK